MLFILLTFYLASVSCTDLQTACPKVTPVISFDVETLGTGIWYEIARYPNAMETTTKCNNFKVEPSKNGFKGISVEQSDSKIVTVFGEMVPYANGRGIVKANMTRENPTASIEIPALHYLYANDRDLLICHGCYYDVKNQSLNETAWIFSRTRALSSDTKAKIKNILDSSKAIDSSKLIMIDNSDC